MMLQFKRNDITVQRRFVTSEWLKDIISMGLTHTNTGQSNAIHTPKKNAIHTKFMYISQMQHGEKASILILLSYQYR